MSISESRLLQLALERLESQKRDIDAEIAELTRHFLGTTIGQRGHYREVTPDTVLEIAFDSIRPSGRHNSGLAMRFPRIVRVRRDKSPGEIDTVAAARLLVK